MQVTSFQYILEIFFCKTKIHENFNLKNLICSKIRFTQSISKYF